MTRATAHIGTVDYATTIEVAGRTLTADEPPENGGQDAGLAPYDLLTSSLAACTAITLRMYAERKGWPLTGADVMVHFYRDGDREKIERTITLHGTLTGDQIARLGDISERTPVTKTLKNGLEINTVVK